MQKESVRKGKFATPSAKPRPAVSLFTIPGASLGAHLLTAALLPLLVVCCCLAPELLTLGVAGGSVAPAATVAGGLQWSIRPGSRSSSSSSISSQASFQAPPAGRWRGTSSSSQQQDHRSRGGSDTWRGQWTATGTVKPLTTTKAAAGDGTSTAAYGIVVEEEESRSALLSGSSQHSAAFEEESKDDAAGGFHPDTFLFNEMDIKLLPQKETAPVEDDGVPKAWGETYADYMFEVNWSTDEGWSKAQIRPVENFNMHPATLALQYAVQLFEGLKAYRGRDGVIRLFRPDANIQRMRTSAARLALPDFDGDEFLRCLKKLVEVNRDWVPTEFGESLYIRPVFIGMDTTVRVSPARQAKLYVVCSPVGNYFGNPKPVSLLADGRHVRAFPGGVGCFKLGCNYAPSIQVNELAKEVGCDQVLWLFDKDEEKLTEGGTMNIFIYWVNENGEKELVTPPLEDGLILPGVTRNSLLALARHWAATSVEEGGSGFSIVERYPTMGELTKALAENRVIEVFGSGTACLVCPVGRIVHRRQQRPSSSTSSLSLAVEKEGEVEMVSLCLPVPGINNNASEESLMRRLGQALQSIQYGEGEEGATGGDDGESLPECASQWTLVVEGRSDRH